jgi:hypothetical protein
VRLRVGAADERASGELFRMVGVHRLRIARPSDLREHKPSVSRARADFACVYRVARTLLRRGYTLGMPPAKRKAAAKGREAGSRKAACMRADEEVEEGTLAAGQRLRVYWPKERSWFIGTVSGSTVYEDGVLINQVCYDDGDVQWHDLRPQATRWSILDAGGDSLPPAPPDPNNSFSGVSSAAPPDGRHDVGGDTPPRSAGGHALGTPATMQQPAAATWAYVLSQSGVGVADGEPTAPIGFEVGSSNEGMNSDAVTPLQRRRARHAATQRRSRAAAIGRHRCLARCNTTLLAEEGSEARKLCAEDSAHVGTLYDGNECAHCCANLFKGEGMPIPHRRGVVRGKHCCQNGQVVLPAVKELPALSALFKQRDEAARTLQRFARKFNNALALAWEQVTRIELAMCSTLCSSACGQGELVRQAGAQRRGRERFGILELVEIRAGIGRAGIGTEGRIIPKLRRKLRFIRRKNVTYISSHASSASVKSVLAMPRAHDQTQLRIPICNHASEAQRHASSR